MKKTTYSIALLFLAGSFFLAGCSENPASEPTAKNTRSSIKSAIKKAPKSRDLQTRINYLRNAYDQFQTLEIQWPDDEALPAFQKEYSEKVRQIPQQVYGLAMQTGDLEAFKWALDHSAPLDTQYSELLKFWKLGRDWQEFILSKDPKALSIFINRAVEENNVKFFDRHVGDFKATGYKLVFPLEKTEFNARFCRYFANKIAVAMRKGDTERIDFLIDQMPPLAAVVHIDWKTKETMQELGVYVCTELKNETLACKLIELGYDMNRIDLAKTGFKPDGSFFQALEAHPEYAIIHVLKLHEWKGSLSPEEIAFTTTLPDHALQQLHDLHFDEVIKSAVKTADLKNAVHLLQLREKTRPLTRHDYDKLLGWSLESGNTAVFDYIKNRHKEIDIFSINLDQLAQSPKIFARYAPQILGKIYPTMDKEPKSDGTTYGRLHTLFTSYHPRVVLYVVQRYDLKGWTKATEGRTLLMDVCEGGNLEAARYLVEHKGADIHAQTGYIELKVTIFGHMQAREGRLTPLFFAAKSGNTKLIRYLAAHKSIINARSAYGATPLMYAVDNNHLEAVKTLIALGANVNAQMNENLTQRELADIGNYNEISTAYRRALKTGNQAMIELLKKAGARL
jgi:hypothetical protein